MKLPAYGLVFCLAAGAAIGGETSPEVGHSDSWPVDARPLDKVAQLENVYRIFNDLMRDRKYDEALPYAEQAYRLAIVVYGPLDKRTAELMLNLGRAQLRTGDAKEAIATLDGALRLYEQLYGADAIELVEPLLRRGNVAVVRDPGGARRYYQRALKIARAKLAPDDVQLADVTLEVGKGLLRQKEDWKESNKDLTAAYDQYKRQLPPDLGRIADAALWLGRFYFESGKLAEAVPYFNEVLGAFEQGGATDDLAESAHWSLVNTYAQLHDAEGVTAHCIAIGRLHPWNEKFQTPLYRIDPNYPPVAIGAGQEGWVEIRFTIDATGAVRDPVVASVTGAPSFGEAALRAIKQWRYAPRIVDGSPVDTPDVKAVLQFQLQK